MSNIESPLYIKIIENVNRFFDKHLLRILVGTGALLVIFLALWGYFRFRQSREEKVSFAVNESVRKLSQLENDPASLNETQIGIVRGLESLYDEYKGLKNGRRALFVASSWYHKNGDLKKAAEGYQKIYEKSSGGIFVPYAILYSAIIKTDSKNYEEALELISRLEKYYLTHYLYGRGLLLKARIMTFQSKPDEAAEIYRNITENKELAVYAGVARKGLAMLSVVR